MKRNVWSRFGVLFIGMGLAAVLAVVSLITESHAGLPADAPVREEVLTLAKGTYLADPKDQNMTPGHLLQLEGDMNLGYLGWGPQPGAENGVAMGGAVGLRYETPGRGLMILGELRGQAYSNPSKKSDASDPSTPAGTPDMRFSQFYFNAMMGLGSPTIKWVTPANITLNRDLSLNETMSVRFAFSGIYLRPLDLRRDAGEFKAQVDAIANFVYTYLNYDQGYQVYVPAPVPTDCVDKTTCIPQDTVRNEGKASSRNIFGLYAAIRGFIEKNGWAGELKLEVVQDISLSYTKVQARAKVLRALPTELPLSVYLEGVGGVDRDLIDPLKSVQTVGGIFAGLRGNFDILPAK